MRFQLGGANGLVLATLLNLGCGGAAPPVESTIHAKHDFGVCTRDPDIEINASHWSYANPEAPVAVSNLHPFEFNRATLESGIAYHYDPFAPARSVKVLPIRLSNLPCDRMHKVELEVPELRPCSGDICALSLPNEIALPNDSGFCRLENAQANIGPVRGNWLGQTDAPIRSRYFCETEPVVPSNATVRIVDKEGEIAWLDAFAYGYRVSLLLTQAEADAQAFINHSDPWIVKLFKKDPGSVDAIMQRIASALDAIPEPRQYDREYTAMLAADGYASGARQGAFEVEAKLFVIEASATIAEVALTEIVLGPLGGANILRAAVSRLGRIPIFIPGAVNGVGGFYRFAKVAARVVKPSARRLAAAMKRAGIFRPADTIPHHIVAHGAENAKKSLAILEKFGIHVDEAVNGVYLPATKELAEKMGSTAHRHIHTNAYYEKVFQELEKLTTKADVERKLRDIANRLARGVFM